MQVHPCHLQLHELTLVYMTRWCGRYITNNRHRGTYLEIHIRTNTVHGIFRERFPSISPTIPKSALRIVQLVSLQSYDKPRFFPVKILPSVESTIPDASSSNRPPITFLDGMILGAAIHSIPKSFNISGFPIARNERFAETMARRTCAWTATVSS